MLTSFVATGEGSVTLVVTCDRDLFYSELFCEEIQVHFTLFNFLFCLIMQFLDVPLIVLNNVHVLGDIAEIDFSYWY